MLNSTKILKDESYKEAAERQFFIIDFRDIMYSVPNIPATYAVLKLRGLMCDIRSRLISHVR